MNGDAPHPSAFAPSKTQMMKKNDNCQKRQPLDEFGHPRTKTNMDEICNDATNTCAIRGCGIRSDIKPMMSRHIFYPVERETLQ